MKPGFDEKKEWDDSSCNDYHFGGITGELEKEILVPDGDWRPYYPEMEVQRKLFDTYSCVSFANNNIEEMIHKCRYGEEVNRSDRFLSVASGTVPGRGNSHKAVAEAKRKRGVCDETEYPFTYEMSQSEFFAELPKRVLDLGLKWVEEVQYGYEKVSITEFKEVLKYSPIQVAVDSRTNRTKNFSRADHSIVLTHIDKKGIPYVFDSYIGRFETYDKDYPFSYGQRYHYKKILNVKLQDYIMQLIRNEENGKIYLVDSDNRIHHIEEEPDFKEIFGLNAWLKKDWVNVPASEIAKYSEGVSLSSRKVAFIAQLKDLFINFGKKL